MECKVPNCEGLVSKCSCGFLLCPHKVASHLNLGHTLYSLPQTKIVRSLEEKLGEIHSHKSYLLKVTKSIVSEVQKLTNSQLSRINKVEQTILNLISRAADFNYLDEEPQTPDVEGVKSSQVEELENFHKRVKRLVKFKVGKNRDFIVSGSSDKSISVWDLKTGERKHVFRGHKDKVWGVAISKNSQFLVSGGYDGFIKVWDLDKKIETLSFGDSEFKILSLAISHDDHF